MGDRTASGTASGPAASSSTARTARLNAMTTSKNMSDIGEAMRLKAQNLLANQFMDPSSMENLSRMRLKVQKELTTAEAQLHNAVSTKLDALKRAVDISADSSEKLRDIATRLATVDDCISTTNTDISHFEHLRKLHYARDNLAKVRAQVRSLCCVLCVVFSVLFSLCCVLCAVYCVL